MLRLALLGDPVAHSRSPAIHTAALAALNLSGTYEAWRVDEEGVAAAIDALGAGELAGANVTMPHKERALALAGERSAEAERAGAANTLSRRHGIVAADNTDIGGIRDVWRLRRLPADGPVLVLGSGGAAAAALVALEGRALFVSGRTPGRGMALADRIGVAAMEIGWGDPIPDATVINATPLGMRSEELPPAPVAAAAGLLDMAYGADPTPAVMAMRGRPVADGLDLLVAQAARSFEIWTDRAAPIDVMEAAARA